jgi:hypothetical protein
MEDVGVFYGLLVYFTVILYMYFTQGHLVYCVVIGYILW